jgi:hypothetical protein
VTASLDSPSAITALILLEMGVGGLVLTWIAPTWGKVRHGYEMLLGSTVLLMIWGGRAALSSPLARLVEAEDATAAMRNAAELVQLLLLVCLGAGVLSMAALATRVALPARLLGIVSVLAGVGSFLPLAQLQRELIGSNLIVGILELVLGALLLGGIWTGMILGHWYLVERKLTNKYMIWVAWLNVVAVAAGLASILISLANPAPEFGMFSPLLSVGNMTLTLGIGTLGLVALISGFNVKLAKEGGRSIQASTGMFYLAVILAPAAEFAAKIRYF